ncbi:MAG TPA: ADOP family duplicated permease [Acidobacteriota bacterium]|nr:ADOP family duplicated permease [Acidobacteriota bacterium]
MRSPIPDRWPLRLAKALLALVSPVVPAGERRLWREEWESELWHGFQARAEGAVSTASGENRGGDPSVRQRSKAASDPGLLEVWPFLRGCWKDALELRRIENRRMRHRNGHRGLLRQGAAAWMKGTAMLLQDLRLSARGLLKSPAFALAAILTLALGIGANSAVFSVIHGLLLRPLGYPDAERMVVISTFNHERGMGPMMVAGPRLADLIEGSRTLEAVSGLMPEELDLTGRGEARQVVAARLLSNMTGLLDLEVQLGRTLGPSDFEPGAANSVLLTDEIWKSQFGGSRDVVGDTLHLNGQEHVVIGVLGPGFESPSTYSLILPLRVSLSELGQGQHTNFYVTLGRLAEDSTMGQLAQELEAFDAANAERQGRSFGFTLEAAKLRPHILGSTSESLMVLWAAVALVLLIACANVTNLLLSRTSRRRQESAVRAALGAGRWPLMRQYLSESLLLSFLGGAAGIALAYLLVWLLKSQGPRLPFVDQVALNLPVLVFTLGLALLTSLLAGLIPAWKASRFSDSLVPNARQGMLAERRGRLPFILNAIQVAVALTLLVGAGLLLRSFWSLTSVDPGFRSQSTLAMGVALPTYRFPEKPRRLQLMEQMVHRLNAYPGVRSAAAANLLPMAGGWSKMLLQDEETPEHLGEMSISAQATSPGYFKTLGIGLRGRDFAWSDREGAREVVIVNRRFAELFWPGQEAVGQVLPGSDPEVEVIGVSDNVRFYGLGQEIEPTWYFPYLQSERDTSYLRLVVQPEPSTRLSAAQLRAALGEVVEDLPIQELGTMTSIIRRSVSRPRFNALLLACFALTAALLAAIGIYGVLSHSVTSRRAEIGVRMALGADASRILRQVIGQGMLPVVLGLVLGLAAAVAAGGLLASQLFGVRPEDPVTLVAVPAFLALVALLACYLPARRATQVDPATTLRAS